MHSYVVSKVVVLASSFSDSFAYVLSSCSSFVLHQLSLYCTECTSFVFYTVFKETYACISSSHAPLPTKLKKSFVKPNPPLPVLHIFSCNPCLFNFNRIENCLFNFNRIENILLIFVEIKNDSNPGLIEEHLVRLNKLLFCVINHIMVYSLGAVVELPKSKILFVKLITEYRKFTVH